MPICCSFEHGSHKYSQNFITREYTPYEPQEYVETHTKKSKVVHSKTFLKYREYDDNKHRIIANITVIMENSVRLMVSKSEVKIILVLCLVI